METSVVVVVVAALSVSALVVSQSSCACACWRLMVVFAARRVSHSHLKRVILEDFVF